MKYTDKNILQPTFGSPMPTRTWSDPNAKYKYGFNGQESLNELTGASFFRYRVYDSRLGRFLSVDPIAIEYPWNSSYAFAENDVIRSIDLEGMERYIVTEVGKTALGYTILSITLDKDLIFNHQKNGVQFLYNGVLYTSLKDPVLDKIYGESKFVDGVLLDGNGKALTKLNGFNSGNTSPYIYANEFNARETTDKPGGELKTYTCEQTQYTYQNSALSNTGAAGWTTITSTFTSPNPTNVVGDVLVTITLDPSSAEPNSMSVTDASGNPIPLIPVATAPACPSPGTTPLVNTPTAYSFCIPVGTTYNITVNSSLPGATGDAVEVNITYKNNETTTSTVRKPCETPEPPVDCSP